MENTIELQLLAVDFRNTRYGDNCNCAISKAVKRQLSLTSGVIECAHFVFIEDDQFKHKLYEVDEFDYDQNQSMTLPDDKVIRTITLTKVKNEEAI